MNTQQNPVREIYNKLFQAMPDGYSPDEKIELDIGYCYLIS